MAEQRVFHPDAKIRQIIKDQKNKGNSTPGMDDFKEVVKNMKGIAESTARKQDKERKEDAKKQGKFLNKLKDGRTELYKNMADQTKELAGLATGFGKKGLDSVVTAMAGPIAGVVEQATGKSLGALVSDRLGAMGGAIKDSFTSGFSKEKGGLFGKGKDDTPENVDAMQGDVKSIKKSLSSMDKRDKDTEKRQKKSKFGATKDKESTGFLSKIFGGAGIAGLLAKFLPGLGGVLTAIATIAAPIVAIGTVLTDFFGKDGGLSKFLGGDILGGIMTTLLGRTAETDADVGKNMLKQGAKGAAIGYMVGGPLGAAIGGGIGLVAAGIKGAFEMEWDKNSKDIGASMTDMWKDPERGIGSKILGTFAAVGKGGIFGPLAGGLRAVGDGLKDRFGNIKDIWADEEKGIFQKIGESALTGIQAIGEVGWNYMKGAGKSLGNFILGATGDFFPNIGKGIKSFFVGEDGKSGIMGKLVPIAGKVDKFVKSIPGLGKIYSLGKSFYGGIGKGIGDFLSDVREEGLGTAMGNAVGSAVDNLKEFGGNIVDSVKDFVSDVKERGLTAVLAEKADSTIRNVAGKVADMGEGIQNFLGNIKDNGLFKSLDEKTEGILGKSMDFAIGLVGGITGFFTDVQEKGLGVAIKENVTKAIDNALGFFADIGRGIKDFFLSIWEGFKDKVTGGWESVKEFFTGSISGDGAETAIAQADAMEQAQDRLEAQGKTMAGIPGTNNTDNSNTETNISNPSSLSYGTGIFIEN